jgi:hypothetical protein
VKVDHFINSQMMAALKNMDVQSPERLLTSDDANQLTMQIMDNIVASQVVDGEYVPDTDQLALKDIVNNALQLQNADVANFSQIVWGSVYWDPVYTRPDKITSYLNKVLKINSGNHSVAQSSAYSETDDDGFNFGLKDVLNIGGKSSSTSKGSASYNEMLEWFRQHNYDVEIKGDIFVPKSLNLKKINIGVLNRQETIYTKSVQMRHVDAPGLLGVTVGSMQSIGESEDIKQLRNNMAEMIDRFNKLEPRVENLEPLQSHVYQMEAQMVNETFQNVQLTKRFDQIEISVKSLLAVADAAAKAAVAKAHQDAVEKCKNNCNNLNGGSIPCLFCPPVAECLAGCEKQ